MVFLWLSIICSTLIYFLFKIRDKFKVNLSGAIIVNYLMATFLGLFLNSNKIHVTTIISTKWFPFSVLIGFLFVLMFFLIGISSEKTGITLTSIATRMSMVLPMLFSMLFLLVFSCSDWSKLQTRHLDRSDHHWLTHHQTEGQRLERRSKDLVPCDSLQQSRQQQTTRVWLSNSCKKER